MRESPLFQSIYKDGENAGEARGMARGMAQALVELLASRLGSVAPQVGDLIIAKALASPGAVDGWFKQALHATPAQAQALLRTITAS